MTAADWSVRLVMAAVWVHGSIRPCRAMFAIYKKCCNTATITDVTSYNVTNEGRHKYVREHFCGSTTEQTCL